MKLHRPVTYKLFFKEGIVQKKTGGKTLKIAIFRVFFLMLKYSIPNQKRQSVSVWGYFKGQNQGKISELCLFLHVL